MSVLIKGMEMPKSNTMFTVTLRVRQDGTAEFISTSGKTVKSFPMIEVPTPHGALVDINEVKNKMLKYGFKAPDMTVTEFIEDELTIILENVEFAVDDLIKKI